MEVCQFDYTDWAQNSQDLSIAVIPSTGLPDRVAMPGITQILGWSLFMQEASTLPAETSLPTPAS